MSFSRAEVVAAHHLSPVQHATVKAIKRLKKRPKENQEEERAGRIEASKSYFSKMATLLHARDWSSDAWTGVTAGVLMVLDWLERSSQSRGRTA